MTPHLIVFGDPFDLPSGALYVPAEGAAAVVVLAEDAFDCGWLAASTPAGMTC